MCLKRLQRQAVRLGVLPAGQERQRRQLAAVAQRRDAARVAAGPPAVGQMRLAAVQGQFELFRRAVEVGGELDDQLGGTRNLLELLVAVLRGVAEVAAKVEVGDVK